MIKKTNGMVSLKEAYERAMNQKKDDVEINVKNNKTTLSPNISGAKIDSSFALESFAKINDSNENLNNKLQLNNKQQEDVNDELDFNFKGLNIQVARRF